MEYYPYNVIYVNKKVICQIFAQIYIIYQINKKLLNRNILEDNLFEKEKK